MCDTKNRFWRVGLLWRLWMCDPGTGSGKEHHDENFGFVTPGTMSGRMVTVDTMDM